MKPSLVRAAVIVAQFACATAGNAHDANYKYLYGQRIVEYGDGREPGVVFSVPRGTPVVAASGGTATHTTASKYGGYDVGVVHGIFTTWYVHLDEVRVKQGQPVKRGDLIGLSGADYRGRQYLHFRICRPKIFCNYFEHSFDPAKYWLGGGPQCFDRGTDYSQVAQTRLTLPIACGDHAKELLTRAGKT